MCMRKFQNFAFAGAIALAGAAGLTACSSDDASEAPVNPTFDGESVKAAFAISLPTTVGGGTRMSENETQSNEQFQGMKNIYMFPFALTSGEVQGSTPFDLKAIKLANINNFDYATANKKIYNDQNFEIGTSHFLFYGETNVTSPKGSLTPSYLSTMPSQVNKINFTLSTAYDARYEKTVVVDALNNIYTKLAAEANGDDVKKLATLMKNLDASNNAQPFAGSSTSVLALVEDIYNSLATLTKTSVLSDYVSTDGSKTFKATNNSGYYTLEWSTNPNYPACVGLPDGAISVKWDGGAFAQELATISGVTQTAYNKYMKPAALYYFVNTPAMTDDETHFDAGATPNYQSVAWNTIVAGGQYTETPVAATTRSVILKNQVNYGVALLESKINAVTASLHDSKDNIIPVTASKNFKVTGILIGGQKNVNWDFTTNTTDDEKTVWDGTPTKNTSVSPSAATEANYTLLLETVANTSVTVCLELENNCQDFYGKDGKLIPYGTKFYLVGQLDPQASTGVTNPSSINQVFKQDYKTVANFTLGENTLKSAYNVIPDLRTPKLEFGLSVDLTWQTGLTFNVDL